MQEEGMNFGIDFRFLVLSLVVFSFVDFSLSRCFTVLAPVGRGLPCIFFSKLNFDSHFLLREHDPILTPSLIVLDAALKSPAPVNNISLMKQQQTSSSSTDRENFMTYHEISNWC